MREMAFRIVWIGIVAMGSLVWAQDDLVFHAGVSLVHVDAEVRGHNERNLTGFSKDDFRVFDEGKEQPVVSFQAEQQPLDVILLFNVSGSMGPKIRSVASAAKAGLNELRNGDRVSVMVFNTKSRVVAPFSENLDAVARSIQNDVLREPFAGGTFIQQGVDDAALRFFHEPRTGRRRAVLIITDNYGVHTRRERSVLRDFWEADTLLSGLILRGRQGRFTRSMDVFTDITVPESLVINHLAFAGMQGIAAKTGGDALVSDDPGAAFREMMYRIRNRYSLYYVTPNGQPGNERTIRIELSADARARFPNARVLARRGYIMPERQ